MKTKLILVAIMAVGFLAACNSINKVVTTEGVEASTNVQSGGEDKLDTLKRYALVIGNANYTGDLNIKPLRNPVNDAREMKTALEKVEFEVIYRENISDREEMENAVSQFSQKLESGGVGLFYYAGHGIQAQGVNYLIPTTVSIPTQVELKHRAMRADFVLEKMEYANNDLNLIILDACRNNPLPTRGRNVSQKGLAKMNNPAGSILIYSTAAGARAYDGNGQNGVFTKHLLRGIRDYGDIPVEAMLKKVRIAVAEETSDEPVPQIPWQNSSLNRDFCFSVSGCFDPEVEKTRQQAEQAEKARQQAADQSRREAEKIEQATPPQIDEEAILEAAKLILESRKAVKEAEEMARQAKIKADRLIQQSRKPAQ